MAALAAGGEEESSGAAAGSPSPAAAAAASLCCFVCGGGIGRGKEQKLQVRPPREQQQQQQLQQPPAPQPFFPFLQHQEPAPGAREVSAEGCAVVCAVCRCFLAEQWAAFERTRTPLDKRMYWLKRPYQCDGPAGGGGGSGSAGLRRAPQEWNLAYALGADDPRRPPDADDDSELSSLSDSLSEAEPRSPAAAAAAAARASPDPGPWRAPKERGGPSAHMGTPAAYRQWSQPPPPPPPPEAAPSSSSSSSVGPGNGLPPAEKPRRKRPRRAPLWRGPRGEAAGGKRGLAAPGEPAGGRCSSEESEINITSDEEQKEGGGGGGPRGARPPWGAGPPGRPEGACYVCGSPLSPASQHRVHVQKQEAASRAPFFPFLWLHSPPPGALPISPAGSAWVCSSCFASLLQQWQSFEVAGVPVLQRLYVVPLGALAPKREGPPREEAPRGPLPPAPDACYLCGEECAKEGRPVAAKVTNGNAKTTMHFPFLSLLPCPPNARGLNKHWEVRSCRRCFGVLQDLWALYRACQNEEFITSLQSFLGRYHQVFSAAEPPHPGRRPLATAGPACVCYICGAELGPGKEFQLSVNPPGRFGEKEPFFPFLTVYPPAPQARPADSTGIVSACVLCYHDLLGQWLRYEGTGTPHPSGAWSRQYKVENFVCFFCRQERKRCQGLKAVRVARLPVFLYSLRVPNSLLVDDGKWLTIGACAECAALVVAGKAAAPRELFAGPAMAPAALPK
ncbi:UNVERIFIED_CONTAM: hypothetical protein K2H54_045562, partial [Gekko kuhli]